MRPTPYGQLCAQILSGYRNVSDHTPRSLGRRYPEMHDEIANVDVILAALVHERAPAGILFLNQLPEISSILVYGGSWARGLKAVEVLAENLIVEVGN